MKVHPVATRARRTRSSYRHRTLAVLTVSAIVIAACGSSDAAKSTQPPSSAAAPAPSGSGAPASGTLKIGTSLPLTGPVADVSKSGIEGYQLWAADVNASGGLLGHQVELKVLDNGFDQAQVSTDYTRLISDDKVDLLLGTFSSFLNGPASAVAARQKMLYVEPSGGASSLFEQGFTNLFLAQPGTSTTLPDRFIEWVKTLPASEKPASAAYLTQDDPSAADAVANFQKGLEALGIKTVYDETYDPNLSNFDPLAAAVANAKPAMIIQGSVAADGAQFSRSLQKLKYNSSILFQVNSPSDAAYPEAVGTGNADGVFTALAWSAQAKYPGNAEFVAGYTKQFGYAPSEDAAN
jgi:branched-chain amino acid transport system substrate-binding protein